MLRVAPGMGAIFNTGVTIMCVPLDPIFVAENSQLPPTDCSIRRSRPCTLGMTIIAGGREAGT